MVRLCDFVHKDSVNAVGNQFLNNKITLESKSAKNGGLGGKVQINQDCKWSKEGRKGKRERGGRGEWSEKEDGFGCVKAVHQQVLGNSEHNPYGVGRLVQEDKEPGVSEGTPSVPPQNVGPSSRTLETLSPVSPPSDITSDQTIQPIVSANIFQLNPSALPAQQQPSRQHQHHTPCLPSSSPCQPCTSPTPKAVALASSAARVGIRNQIPSLFWHPQSYSSIDNQYS